MGGGPMEVTELLGLEGTVTVTVRDRRGRFVRRRVIRNTLTNFLRATVAAWLTGRNNTGQAPLGPPDRIALGTGVGTPAPTDIGLWTETAGTRKACAYVQVYQGYYAQYTTQYLSTDPAGTFTEAGLFDADGNLWAHVSLGSVSRAGNETLTVQWKVQPKGAS